MSMSLYLCCHETRQLVPLGSYSASGGPSGESYSGLLIKMFALAHEGLDLVAVEGGYDEYISWDLPSCVELFERMTQKRVSDSFAAYVAKQCHESGDIDGTWFDLEMIYELNSEKFKLMHRIGPALRPRSDYMT